MSNNKNAAIMKSRIDKAKLPNLRLPKFQNSESWTTKLGREVFDEINNKKHNADLPVCVDLPQSAPLFPRSRDLCLEPLG